MDKIAEVTGVLRYNDATREEMLKRIYWKDVQYTALGGNFVRYANIKDRNVASLTEGQGLFNYTHDRNNEYGAKIQKDYFGNGAGHDTYVMEEIPNGERWKWEGDYYENFTPDTPLERVADMEIIREMALATYAENDRHLEQKYITPKLINFYGSSPGLNTKLLKYTFGQYYTGRISDIEEADVQVQHDYLKYLFTDKDGNLLPNIEAFNEDNVEAPKRHLYALLREAERISGRNLLSDEGRYADFIIERTFFDSKTKKESSRIADRGVLNNANEFSDDNFKVYGNTRRYLDKYAHETNYSENDAAGEDVDENTRGLLYEPGADTSFVEPRYKPKSILWKTNKLFKDHKISSLAARFHTSSEISDEPEITDTAKSKIFGNSHGRNLLKKNLTNIDTNGYENPYCRVWTYHHQYDRISRLIRPFDPAEGEVHDKDPYIAEYAGTTNGRDYLKANTVLGKNGFVNIAPKGDACGNLTLEIKKCMFSLENLAWKDVPRNQGYLSKEQRGPNGGRIMWFPPYDLDFSENVSVDWNQNRFIGRGEPVFTYSNTNRSGTLSFAILIDHPSIIDNIPKYDLNPTDGDDGDLEADVLRFFAGCQIPTLQGDLECEEPVEAVNEGKVPGNEPKPSIPLKEKSKRAKFYVYFPNNYSGNGQYLPKTDIMTNGPSDRSWFDYLVYGRNTIIPNSWESTDPGYEWGKDGLSFDNMPDEYMDVNEKYSPWKQGEGVITGVNYQYRVDFDLHQKLRNRYPGKPLFSRGMGPDSTYKDSKGFNLHIRKDNLPKDATHTFAEILTAMIVAKPERFEGTEIFEKGFVGSSLSGRTDDELVRAFREGLIKDVILTAGATQQDDKNSEMLALRRGISIKTLLENYGDVPKEVFEGTTLIYQDTLNDMTDINTVYAKKQRYASAELIYDVPESQKVSDTVTPTKDLSTLDTSGKTVIEENVVSGRTSNTERPEQQNIEQPVAVAKRPVALKRYETEAEYFKEIEREDPMVYKSIVTKFKYFSPAYHSISPEGFNARLTFLQQCTRQGHTISATDTNFAKTGGNLSFGRMPVCVLRIGDFINTKIIINSLSINYGANGTPQWDLNPEGIGVQPMYAKVQLGITIIGGQSLEGPINRLQNAVSFNYYANTGVYDDRSDRISIVTEKTTGETGLNLIKEKALDKFSVNDNSEYEYTKTVYSNIWSPQPNLVVVDENQNEVMKYNEYLKKGGLKVDKNGNYNI